MEDPQENQPRAVTGIIMLDERTDAERDLDYIVGMLANGQIKSTDELRGYLVHHSEEFGLIYGHAKADLSQRVKLHYFSRGHLTGNAMNSISEDVRMTLFLHSP